ncbi:MAG: hypothetical protein R3E53_08805 [Myxococcota bacterium]
MPGPSGGPTAKLSAEEQACAEAEQASGPYKMVPTGSSTTTSWIRSSCATPCSTDSDCSSRARPSPGRLPRPDATGSARLRRAVARTRAHALEAVAPRTAWALRVGEWKISKACCAP